jgi:hypothetical protein
VLLVLTLVIGFVAVGVYSAQHPMSPEDLARLRAGEISETMSGVYTIIKVEVAAIVVNWIVSMIWAYRAAHKHEG